MAMSPQKRKEMEKLVYDVMDQFDKTGINTDKYKTLFKAMSDTQFDKFFKDLFNSEFPYLVADFVDFERDLRIEDIENASKVLNIPLFEKVVIPFMSKDPNKPVVSKYEVPVGYIHLKRPQQMVFKKNTTSIEVAERSALTGQVTGGDKNARESDTENFVLITKGLEYTMKEFMGPRADDMAMKSEMYSQIAKKGYVSQEELPDDLSNKKTLNTVDAFFIGMGIKTDLVTRDLTLINFDKE